MPSAAPSFFCGLTADDFIEVAALAICGCFLIDKRQALFIEFVEPFIPGNGCERSLAAVSRKINSQYACVVSSSSALNVRRFAATLLGPTAYLLVISGNSIGC